MGARLEPQLELSSPPHSGTLFPYLRRKIRNLRVRIFLAVCAVSIFLMAGQSAL